MAAELSKDGRTPLAGGKAVTSMEYNDVWWWLLHQEQKKRLDVSHVRRLIPVPVKIDLAKYEKSLTLF